MVPHELAFNIEGVSRTLAPFVPARLEATNDKQIGRKLSAALGFMFFKTYTFSFARGHKRRVRIRSADGYPLGLWRYLYGRIAFKLRGVRSLPTSEDDDSCGLDR